MYTVFGYGSLICPESLEQTIPKRKSIPAIIKGYRRVFNRAGKEGSDPNVLNIEKSKEDINCVIFKVNDEELVHLKRREFSYNMEETEAYDLEGKRLGRCFIFIDYHVGLDRQDRKPNKRYFIMCRKACYNISEEFGRMFDKTSYTSGGERISEWLKKNRDYDALS